MPISHHFVAIAPAFAAHAEPASGWGRDNGGTGANGPHDILWLSAMITVHACAVQRRRSRLHHERQRRALASPFSVEGNTSVTSQHKASPSGVATKSRWWIFLGTRYATSQRREHPQRYWLDLNLEHSLPILQTYMVRRLAFLAPFPPHGMVWLGWGGRGSACSCFG